MENIKISENSKKSNISLEELSLEISKKFWLESKKISFLIKEIRENSVYSLENLKAELQKENKTLELQKIQELFYQAKNQSEDMIAKSINENNENDYTSYHLYNLMIYNQMSIVNQLEEIITFYQHLDKEEQSKTPLIGMIKLSNLDNN